MNQFDIQLTCQNYDCNMNEMKNCPTVKFRMKTIRPFNYDIPPVVMDFESYMAKTQGFNQSNPKTCCQTGVREPERFPQRIKNQCCNKCKKEKSLRQMPHCCNCTCQWYNLRDEMPKCKTECQNVCNDKRPAVKRPYKVQVPKECFPQEEYYCPTEPISQPKLQQRREIPKPRGPMSEYRSAFMPPKCKGPRFYNDPESIFEQQRPKWNRYFQSDKNCCRPSLASTEAKLEALDRLLRECQCDSLPIQSKSKALDQDIIEPIEEKEKKEKPT